MSSRFNSLLFCWLKSGVLTPLIVLGLAAAAFGADDAAPSGERTNPHLWKPRTKSVAVFKNGLGFFTRESEVELRDGWAVAKEIPAAKFGTLAIYSLDEKQAVDVVGSGPGETVEFDGVDVPNTAVERRARLEAAMQLNVQLHYKSKGEDRSAAGKLVSLGPDFAVLETGGNNFAVPVPEIFKMQLLELPLRVHVMGDDAATPEKAQLGMAYLRDGITWIPEYSLKILDDTTAELTLRGTLVNEAEDLIHCDTHFVVGVPHFVHSDYLAPIAVGQVIRTIGTAIAPPGMESQIMSRAAITSNSIRADQFGGLAVEEQPRAPAAVDLQGKLGNLPQLESSGGSDYTVYTKKDLTLRRGERAIVTLLVQKITYSHVYRWSPPAAMEHFLVLQNDTDSAWTTGPCLATSGGRPLSEDLLKYTPARGHVELPIASAVNVSHDQSEVEADRKLKAHSPNEHQWLDLVTLEGTLQLKNFEKTPVELIVTASVPGKPIQGSDDAVRSADSTKLQLLDRAGTIRWTVKLKPQESKTLKYAYERFVPSS